MRRKIRVRGIVNGLLWNKGNVQSLNNSCFRKIQRNHLINGSKTKARLLFFFFTYIKCLYNKFLLISYHDAKLIVLEQLRGHATCSETIRYLTICSRLLFSEDLDSRLIVRGFIGR